MIGNSRARPRPAKSNCQLIPPMTEGPTNRVAATAATGSRDRQRREAGGLVASPLGEQDVGGPADRRPEGETHPDRVGAPCHGSVSNSTPAAATTAQTRADERPLTIATPNGPRNSSALAVPSGSRLTAAMNSNVIAAVTIPSRMQVTRPDRVKDARHGRSEPQDQPGPGQPQPCRALRADLVEEPDGCGDPNCTQHIDAKAIDAPTRRPGPAGVVMSRSTHTADRSCPRDNHGQFVR